MTLLCREFKPEPIFRLQHYIYRAKRLILLFSFTFKDVSRNAHHFT